MKSGTQRRTEILQRRKERRAAEAKEQTLRTAERRTALLKTQVVVNVDKLRPTNSYGTPDFVARGFYVDRPFNCKTCASPQVWTATQQRWWYEIAQGDVWTVAVLCRSCRRRERERKNAAREVHLAGLAKKSSRP